MLKDGNVVFNIVSSLWKIIVDTLGSSLYNLSFEHLYLSLSASADLSFEHLCKAWFALGAALVLASFDLWYIQKLSSLYAQIYPLMSPSLLCCGIVCAAKHSDSNNPYFHIFLDLYWLFYKGFRFMLFVWHGKRSLLSFRFYQNTTQT